MGERRNRTAEARGSIPLSSTNFPRLCIRRLRKLDSLPFHDFIDKIPQTDEGCVVVA